MLALTLIAALATSAHSLAIPQPQDGGGVYAPFPLNTSMTYYQGSTSSDTCAISVGTGMIAAETCTPLLWSAVGIAQSPNNTCSFTLFSGSTTCADGNGNLTSEKTVFQLERGEGVVCVDVGVLDGGKFQKASGMWSCG